MAGFQLPCFPSQVSLIPLHDGHVLPSPTTEHDEEDVASFASLAYLSEQRYVEMNPSLGSLAAPPQESRSALAKASQVTPSEPLLTSLTYPKEQPDMNFTHVKSNRSFYPMAASSRTSGTGMALERSSNASHLLISLSWFLIFTCIVIGIAATVVSGYY